MNISSVIGEGPATPNLDIGIISVHPLVPFAGDFLGKMHVFDHPAISVTHTLNTLS